MQRKLGVVVTVLVLTAVGVALPATAFAGKSTGMASVQGFAFGPPCMFAGMYMWSGFANAGSVTITVDDLTTNVSHTTTTQPLPSGNQVTLDVPATFGDAMTVKGVLSTATGSLIKASIASTPKKAFSTVGLPC
jgi:hypothetical protein